LTPKNGLKNTVYCIHSDTKACFCLDSRSTLGARLTALRAHRVVSN